MWRTKKEIDAITTERLSVFARNRKLIHDLNVLSKEKKRLKDLVECLEDENMELMRSIVDVDWNFNSSIEAPSPASNNQTGKSSESLQESKLPPIRSIKSLPIQQEIRNIDNVAKEVFSEELDTRQLLMAEFGVRGEKMDWCRKK
jgi:hypothetical protein